MHTFLVQVGQIEGSQKHPFVGANLACVYAIRIKSYIFLVLGCT